MATLDESAKPEAFTLVDHVPELHTGAAAIPPISTVTVLVSSEQAPETE